MYEVSVLSIDDTSYLLSLHPYSPWLRPERRLSAYVIANEQKPNAVAHLAKEYVSNLVLDLNDLVNALKNLVLIPVSLGHLQDRLEHEQDWTRILSLGEQQRLAFARLLLHKPNVAFLDEATASMDEGLEDNMYRLLKEHLPHTTVISVGHRSTLQAFHQQQLMILGNSEWQFTDRNLV